MPLDDQYLVQIKYLFKTSIQIKLILNKINLKVPLADRISILSGD